MNDSCRSSVVSLYPQRLRFLAIDEQPKKGDDHEESCRGQLMPCLSDQQAQAQTIASQVAALRDRGDADDCMLLPECEFIDEGIVVQR
jgi:hypothetical protein